MSKLFAFMKIRYFLTFTFCFVYLLVISQDITGLVIDSKTNEPLSGASVYFNNTTIGTITNSEGEFAIKYNTDLKTELVISFIGYETFIIGDLFFKEDLVIPLTESVNVLNEIELTSRETWSRELKLNEFKKHFLGESSRGESCKILNEEDIVLKYNVKNKTLIVVSKAAIIIENNDLKYLISVNLQHFKAKYSYVSKNKKRLNIDLVSYNGSNYYRSIDVHPTKEIFQTREEAYKGSTMHFMRALASENLNKEGYDLFVEQGQHIRLTNRHFEVSPSYDQNGVIVKIKRNKVNVLYKGVKRSSIECTEDQFYIDNFGNHTPPETVIFTGDFGNQRMGDTLPLDYFVSEPLELN